MVAFNEAIYRAEKNIFSSVNLLMRVYNDKEPQKLIRILYYEPRCILHIQICCLSVQTCNCISLILFEFHQYLGNQKGKYKTSQLLSNSVSYIIFLNLWPLFSLVVYIILFFQNFHVLLYQYNLSDSNDIISIARFTYLHMKLLQLLLE